MKDRHLFFGYFLHRRTPWIFLIVFYNSVILGQGNLLIFPKRIVFENDEKFKIVNLTNTGEDTATYRISFVQYRLSEIGEFILLNVPDSGQYFSDPFIRYYPKYVTLGPNESQAVKLQLKNSGDLLPVEYRSHLYIRSVDNNKSVHIEQDDSAVSIKLVPVFGMTIPCIIHPVKPQYQVRIVNPELIKDKNTYQISMEFIRSGQFSSYGDIYVYYDPPDGPGRKLGEVKGFAVYSPGEKRRCVMLLPDAKNIDFNEGKIQIIYSSPSSASVQIAAAEILFPIEHEQ